MHKFVDKELDKLGWSSKKNAAFQSLKTALRAYFETYRATFENLDNPIDFQRLKKPKELESNLYKSLYFTTITHFQNFFELILKDILEQIDELLVVKWNEKFTASLYKRIRNQETSHTQSDQSIEYSESLKRLLEIQKTNVNDSVIKQASFLLKERKTLEKLNTLRNRIWHKGLFYLYYTELDLFVCKEILPLVEQIVNLEWYFKNQEWKYKILSCNIDPIQSLIDEIRKKSIDFERIALYKEMGRAAYHNPIISSNNKSIFAIALATNKNRDIERIVNAKTKAVRNRFMTDVFDCPICGQKTLIKYELDDSSYGEEEDEFYPHYIPDRIKCETCTFEVKPNIMDLTLCGIRNFDIWKDHT